MIRLPPPGIGARLAVAIAAVVLLVSATNYLARENARRAGRQVAMIEAQHEPLTRIAQGMVDAAAAFDRTVLELAKAPDSGIQQVDVDLNRLTSLSAEYRRIAADAGETADQVLDRISAHELRARELLLLAEQRRQLTSQYWKSFDALDASAHAAEAALPADAPGGLVQALGRIQDRFGAYAAAGDSETERAVATGETSFRLALDRNQAALTAVPGKAQQMLRNQFEAIIARRRSLVAINGLIEPAQQQFLATGAELTRFINAGISEPARRALADAAMDANAVADQSDKVLGRLGAVTLALLLIISVATAYGVIIPVRKLISATRRLAQGVRGERVPRGGVQELDMLAAAFNDMSEQLEKAEALVRTYQMQLEARVDERTRQLQHLAHHDPLTQLPNRRQLFEHLEATLTRAEAQNHKVGLLFLDLDNFKIINDSLGHEFGDRLLKGVAERLLDSVGSRGFTARLGGDEFTVVCERATSLEMIKSVADEMLQQFQRPLLLEGRELTVGVSVGASVFPDHAADATSLLRAADAALFRAKEAGRNRYSLYNPELLKAASLRFQTEQELRRAIENAEFELVFQPQVATDSLSLNTVEALLRWRRTDGSLVSPAEFIEIAERSGLIKDISEWVLTSAIATAAAWYRDGWKDVRVAINVSSQQLLDGAFLLRLEETLRVHALPPECLEIELTENVVQTGSATIEALHWLRSLGVALALDDFGTGYSSLTSIERLPLTRVKIDRSLMADIDSNPRSAAIVRSIISLCASLHLRVTAEGIERRSQLAFMRSFKGVDVQGYLVSPPVSVTDIDRFRAQLSAQVQAVVQELPSVDANPFISDSMVVRQLKRIPLG